MAREQPRREHVKHQRVFDLKAALAEIEQLKAKNHQLVNAYQESLLEHVLDLEIAVGTKKEKDRDQERQRMRTSGTNSPEVLDELRKAMMTVLTMRVHPPEADSDQKNPQGDYIK